MKRHDNKRRFLSGSSRAESEHEGWDAEGYVLVDNDLDGGASEAGTASDDDSARYRTVRRAAKEVGIPERTIREWVLMGHLSAAPDITAGYSPFLVNVIELRKVAARLLGSG
jgi:hypothetical protein